MLMEKIPDEGKVRVMFVSESARGKGVGNLLIDTLINKARAVGYQTLSLWTTNNQTEARTLYRKVGFSLVSESPNITFAKDSFDEEWKMNI
jgi:GNAT superfamily N-acetyltransferase